MKITFGRKFLGALICSILLTASFILALAIQKTIPEAVIILYMCLIVTNWFMYIGGNVWKSWVKSKYFKNELNGGEGES